MTLEDLLVDLQRYGQPRLGVYGSDGFWHCHVEMNTITVGVKVEAKSGWKHKTPIEAAVECQKRILEALEAMGSGAHLRIG